MLSAGFNWILALYMELACKVNFYYISCRISRHPGWTTSLKPPKPRHANVDTSSRDASIMERPNNSDARQAEKRPLINSSHLSHVTGKTLRVRATAIR